jgi:hypothetical protein
MRLSRSAFARIPARHRGSLRKKSRKKRETGFQEAKIIPGWLDPAG